MVTQSLALFYRYYIVIEIRKEIVSVRKPLDICKRYFIVKKSLAFLIVQKFLALENRNEIVGVI